MAKPVKVQIKGGVRLIAELRKAAPALLKASAPILAAAAQDALAQARTLAPEDTGGLKRSGRVDPVETSTRDGYAMTHVRFEDPDGTAAWVHELHPSNPHFLRDASKAQRS